MPEALTESFCERCGTRYEFAAPTELNTMRKTRGLISGLRNYIMSQDALGDAVGDAMRSEEEALASQQLEAFHESFNFCIDCRQYSCTNCWNDGAGRCRSCVPIAGTDDLLERFETSFHAQHPELAAAAHEAEMAQRDLNRRLGMETWPTEDLTAGIGNGHGPVEWPTEEPMIAEVEAEPAPELEPAVAEAEAEPEPELMVAAAQSKRDEYPPLHVVAWEEDGTVELEPEPVAATVEPEAEPEPEPVAATIEPEAEPEPVPIAATVETEPEPAPRPVPMAPIRPISETIVQIPRATAPPTAPPPVDAPEPVAAEADSISLAARRAQLDMLGLGDPGEGPLADRANVLPYRSSGASVHPTEMAARAAAGIPAPGAFWEASAREVAGAMSHVGVQSCGDCGLSLSATARFCRRCGTRQARSA